MVDLLKSLGLAALLAVAAPALAQDTGEAPASEDTEAAPEASAETEAEPQAEAEAEPAPEGEAVAETGDDAAGQPETYIDEVFTDWSRECVRLPEDREGNDPCWITQTLTDDNGRPFGKFSVRRIAANGPAIAQADVAVSMELVPYLPAGVTLGVDQGLSKEFQYLFCTPGTGCLTQPNLSQADIDAFKAGDTLNMGFTIVARATELATISSPISLSGFTAAWDSVPEPNAPAE